MKVLRRARRGITAAGRALLESTVRVTARRAYSEGPEEQKGRSPASIFVLRNNDLGDLLVVTPLFELLRRRFPEAEIVAGIGRWHEPLLAHNPHLTGTLRVEGPWFNKVVEPQGPVAAWRFLGSAQAKAVGAAGFDAGIDVLGSAWGRLLLLRSGIPRRYGVRGYAGGDAGLTASIEYDPSEHVGAAALRLGRLLGSGEEAETEPVENRPQVFLTESERAAGRASWRTDRPRVLVSPGAGLAVKAWPLERFRELTGRLAADPDRPVEVLVEGGPSEMEAAASLPGARSVAGEGLRAACARAAAADLVIANSSFLTHAAAAFARPTLTLLGPAFASRRRHDAQWGHPPPYRCLGPEPGLRGIATVDEAHGAARELLVERRR